MKRQLIALLVLACLALPALLHAQTVPVPVPALSLQRLSIGIGADYVLYRPGPILGLERRGEVQVNTALAYNLGRFVSLAGSVAYGLDSQEKFYKAGVRLHLLSRGGRP